MTVIDSKTLGEIVLVYNALCFRKVAIKLNVTIDKSHRIILISKMMYYRKSNGRMVFNFVGIYIYLKRGV